MTKNGYVFHAERLTGGASSNLDNGYQELIAAIIRQAVKDYVSVLLRLFSKPDGAKRTALEMQKTELEVFFHSEWYASITDLDGDRLISAARTSGRGKSKGSDPQETTEENERNGEGRYSGDTRLTGICAPGRHEERRTMMKTGISLQEVMLELDRQNKAKKDYIGSARALRLYEDGQTFEIGLRGRSASVGHGHAFSTGRWRLPLASRPSIMTLMQTRKPELLAQNVNAWFGDRENSYMIRTMDYGAGRMARALLSDRYRRIDNMEIASAVFPLFAGSDQYEVVSSEVTENRLYLKIVNRRLEMAVVPGDIVQAGVMISNSEVGLGSVSVQPLVYRLVCTMGMLSTTWANAKNHVGRAAKAVDDSFHIYSDETMEAEDKAYLLKLRDVTLAAIEESRFAQVVGRLKEAAGIPITGKVTEVVELTARAYGITPMNRTASCSI